MQSDTGVSSGDSRLWSLAPSSLVPVQLTKTDSHCQRRCARISRPRMGTTDNIISLQGSVDVVRPRPNVSLPKRRFHRRRQSLSVAALPQCQAHHGPNPRHPQLRRRVRHRVGRSRDPPTSTPLRSPTRFAAWGTSRGTSGSGKSIFHALYANGNAAEAFGERFVRQDVPPGLRRARCAARVSRQRRGLDRG